MCHVQAARTPKDTITFPLLLLLLLSSNFDRLHAILQCYVTE